MSRVKILVLTALLFFAFSITFLFVGLYAVVGQQDICFATSSILGSIAFFFGLLAYLEG